MKGKVLGIFPTLRDDPERDMEFVELQIGLGKPTLAGVKKGAFRIGQVVEVPYQLLGRDGDDILIGMARELYEHGQSDVEEVDCPELDGARLHPLNYRLNEDDGGLKAGYLQKIWHTMSELGKFDVRPGFVFYFLNIPATDGALWEIVSLGHLISEYQWRIEHEAAAEAEYRARENRRRGSAMGARERRLQGAASTDAVLEVARLVLDARPSLARNDSQLALRVLDVIADQQIEFGWHKGVNIQHQQVRKIIAKLRRGGRL